MTGQIKNTLAAPVTAKSTKITYQPKPIHPSIPLEICVRQEALIFPRWRVQALSVVTCKEDTSEILVFLELAKKYQSAHFDKTNTQHTSIECLRRCQLLHIGWGRLGIENEPELDTMWCWCSSCLLWFVEKGANPIVLGIGHGCVNTRVLVNGNLELPPRPRVRAVSA